MSTLPTIDSGGRWRSAPRELITFAGPSGREFSDGKHVYSTDKEGRSRWDFNDGFRTGYLPGFSPTYHHRGAGELAQVVEGTLIRWKIGDSDG